MRELRQNLSKYLDRVKEGEGLTVTERGKVVARLIPAGDQAGGYEALAERYGATVPSARLEDMWSRLPPIDPAPAGTADALLAEGRRDRA